MGAGGFLCGGQLFVERRRALTGVGARQFDLGH